MFNFGGGGESLPKLKHVSFLFFALSPEALVLKHDAKHTKAKKV